MNNYSIKGFLILAPVLCCLFSSRGILHYFQLESYQFPGYFRTLFRNKKHSFLPGILSAFWMTLLFYLFDLLVIRSDALAVRIIGDFLLLTLSAAGGWCISKAFAEKKAKKKFVYTSRVKRLYVVHFIVMYAVSVLCSFSTFAVLPAFWPIILPLIVALSGLLAWPVEKLISELYFRDARRKLLSNKQLIRIGITGSYGKTTVKHILHTVLSEKYPTFITPASFNTPMGVTRAIREGLTSSYQVFIGEMGARHVGDIREMCRLVKPTIGIITSVGPQHLETFKTIERVASTKYELVEALPQDGHAYFYDDGSFCKKMYDKTEKAKTLCGKDSTSDCWFENLKASNEGSNFTLCFSDGDRVECHTRLLGTHNIQNILLAAAVAKDLGLTSRQIARGIEKLQPVKNRLELMSRPGSFTIINDAFNSNPVGAKAAFQVLRDFPKRRIVITPGMVELGKQEAQYNREFGRQMASCADIAIIIGKNRAMPIIEGLLEAGFAKECIHQVASLDESTALLHQIVRPGDTVLYENDLPDHYQEA